MDYIFQLEIFNNSMLGFQGATAPLIFSKPFKTLTRAKEFAQTRHSRMRLNETLTFKRPNSRKSVWSSGDLGWVEYRVTKIRVG